MEDLYPEKKGCEKESDIDTDDDENPADVVLGGMPLHMTSSLHGRHPKGRERGKMS